MPESLEVIRARAAARARAVRVSGGVENSRAEIETDYMTWLNAIFPEQMNGYRELAPFHHELLTHAWAIRRGIRPKPFFAVWFRGAGKSTLGEMIAVMLGALEWRKYVLYVCNTQDQANDHVNNIRALIENSQIAYYYPEMAEPARSKRTNTMLRWSAEQIQCGNGFTVTGIGLEAAIRGARVANYRPDLFDLDDIDDKSDSIATVEKKISLLTSSIIAAGSNDRAIMGLQNLIHKESVFSRVLSGEGKLFPNRVISGPVEMVAGAKVETRDSVDIIVSGQPSWPAMTIEECQNWLEDLTLRSWEMECQHNVNIPYDDATFREFDPVYHCITLSEMMRYYVGNKAITYNDLQPLQASFNIQGLTPKLILPRGEVSMAQDWGNNHKHLCATRWLWRPGERVPLRDSIFFIREMCWPTWPKINDDPRANPTPKQLYKAILEYERSIGLHSRWDRDDLSIEYRLFSHERPEGANAYRLDFDDPLNFWPIDTKQAKEGILHLQDFLHVDYTQYHPFRVDPRTQIPDTPEYVEVHLCDICGWRHNGLHLLGRPRAFFVVADGQGELRINALGKLEAAPAIDEWGMKRTRYEYPLHRPRETADGEEKQAAKVFDDFVDTDKALMGYVFHMIGRLSDEDRLKLLYRKLRDEAAGVTYPDATAREAALTAVPLRFAEEQEEMRDAGKSWIQRSECFLDEVEAPKSWLQRLDGWDE
ncbi:MAG TPA: hypothetical protein VF131_22980 [Blastocatellia bacterium]|nr:hypothetical protein [Blastocatellia bacterium]